jgi:hypothetical protein
MISAGPSVWEGFPQARQMGMTGKGTQYTYTFDSSWVKARERLRLLKE